MTSRFQDYRKSKKDESRKMQEEINHWKRTADIRARQIEQLKEELDEIKGNIRRQESAESAPDMGRV